MTTISRRMLLAGAALSIALPARAQSWPQRPVMIVVPQPAGNSPDILCRVIAEKLSRYTGLSVAQVDRLREEFAVYLIRTGRICVAGLNNGNVERTAEAMAAVLAA